jgi:hypothetical protein
LSGGRRFFPFLLTFIALPPSFQAFDDHSEMTACGWHLVAAVVGWLQAHTTGFVCSGLKRKLNSSASTGTGSWSLACFYLWHCSQGLFYGIPSFK